MPAVIILERENAEELLNLEVLPKELDREILFKDVSIAWWVPFIAKYRKSG